METIDSNNNKSKLEFSSILEQDNFNSNKDIHS